MSLKKTKIDQRADSFIPPGFKSNFFTKPRGHPHVHISVTLGVLWHFILTFFTVYMGRRGWWGGLWVGVEEGGRKTERKRCCGRIHMFSSQGPLPHKTLYTIPIYRSSEQQQCRSHSLCRWLSLSPSLSPFDCMSLSPSIPRSLSSLGYLIIRQFLAVATYCSGVLGLPDYRVSLKSPKVCTPVCVLRVCASMCVSLTLYLA